MSFSLCFCPTDFSIIEILGGWRWCWFYLQVLESVYLSVVWKSCYFRSERGNFCPKTHKPACLNAGNFIALEFGHFNLRKSLKRTRLSLMESIELETRHSHSRPCHSLPSTGKVMVVAKEPEWQRVGTSVLLLWEAEITVFVLPLGSVKWLDLQW